MIDGRQVKEMLNARIEDVCRYLLPHGFRRGHQWTAGDLYGTPPKNAHEGGSLNVELEGPKVGVWADFAQTGQQGDVIGLWKACRNLEFGAAMDEAKAWLGVKEQPRIQKPSQTTPARPAPRPAEKPDDSWALEFDPVKEGGAVWQWLTGKRKLSPAAIAAYRLGEKTIRRKDAAARQCVVFPSYDESGALVRVKFRDIAEKAYMPTYPRGAPHCLFGIQAIPKDQEELFVTEGELDALSMFDYGHAAVSVPYGAKGIAQDGANPNDPWIEHDYDWLEKFTGVVLALDMDAEGQKATAAIAPRMGRERCRVLTLPAGCKDANECLVKGVRPGDMMEAIIAARDLDPSELRFPRDYRTDVWEQFYPVDGEEPGEPMPWPLPFRFRPCEVTLWHGYTKHGKTVLLQYVLVHFGVKKQRCLVASMEIPAKRTIQNTIRQALGKRKPEDEREFDAALAWLDQWMLLYDVLGEARQDAMIETFRYAAKKYGVRHFVIDSVMKTDVDEEDNEAQKVFMNKICALANELQGHVHVVCHDKKPDIKHPEEKYWPGKYQVRGSAHLVDLAHNVVCVWRNRNKEAQWREAEETLSGEELLETRRRLALINDAILAVQAQRGGDGEESEKRLWFDWGESWQYRDRPEVFRQRHVPE